MQSLEVSGAVRPTKPK